MQNEVGKMSKEDAELFHLVSDQMTAGPEEAKEIQAKIIAREIDRVSSAAIRERMQQLRWEVSSYLQRQDRNILLPGNSSSPTVISAQKMDQMRKALNDFEDDYAEFMDNMDKYIIEWQACRIVLTKRMKTKASAAVKEVL